MASSSVTSSILKYLNDSSSDSSNFNARHNFESQRGKKRRLDHLTSEEKLQRKKLKNRVAAQTSRDRKKAKMDQLERALSELFEKNQTLQTECEHLRTANEKLIKENEQLQDRLKSPCARCEEESRSAGFRMLLPQKKALIALLACLLYPIFWTSSMRTSTSAPSSSSPTASSKTSPETWRLPPEKTILKGPRFRHREGMMDKWWNRHQKVWNPPMVF